MNREIHNKNKKDNVNKQINTEINNPHAEQNTQMEEDTVGDAVIEGIARGICGMKRGGKKPLLRFKYSNKVFDFIYQFAGFIFLAWCFISLFSGKRELILPPQMAYREIYKEVSDLIFKP